MPLLMRRAHIATLMPRLFYFRADAFIVAQMPHHTAMQHAANILFRVPPMRTEQNI